MTDDESTCEQLEGSSGLSAGGSVLGVGSETSDLSVVLAGRTPPVEGDTSSRRASCGFCWFSLTA